MLLLWFSNKFRHKVYSSRLISSPWNFLNWKRGGWNCSELLLFIPTESPAGPWLCPAQPRQGFQPKQTLQVRLTTIPLMLVLAQGAPRWVCSSVTFSSTLCSQFRAAVWVLESTPGSPVQMTWFSLKLEDADLLNAFRKQTVLSKYTQFISLQCTSLRNVGFLPWLKTGLMRRNICQSGDSVVLAMWQASQQSNKIQQLKLGRKH